MLLDQGLLMDLRVDDQEQTLRFLRDGEVLGCVSAREKPLQGCRASYLGRMDYRLLASPGFAQAWFPNGLSRKALNQAPGLIFNRKDELHLKLIAEALGSVPKQLPSHYLPSSEGFVKVLAAGLAYGMLPDQQSGELLNSGGLVDLAQGTKWRCGFFGIAGAWIRSC
jgi:LysR family transcriptional regulator (chromosome initiation inhibitor)